MNDGGFINLDFDKECADRLVDGELHDPHCILGGHPISDNGPVIVRAYHPDANKAWIVFDSGLAVPMKLVHSGGIFAAILKNQEWPFVYRVRFQFRDGNTWEHVDPYRFMPTIGEVDLYLTGEGTHERLYDRLGAHPMRMDGVEGVAFAVWAPNAKQVSVIGDFNRWDGRLYPMRAMGASGVWELFVPGVKSGDLYKFEIKTSANQLRIKTDPMAFAMELRPKNSSMVYDLRRYKWGDGKWMDERTRRDLRSTPMAMYEVHLGSWMRAPDEGNRWLTYREIAPRLAEHVKRFGFTHVELLPVAEHPLDESWGYQVTGYYAPTSRYGSPDDFRYFVDVMHQNGIGVIIDWVPAHFPKDDFSLRMFDGTALYEHSDPRLAEHPDWGTLIFNYGRNEVRNFLLANALFWLDQYHIDALRVDAVASLIYLDYSRKQGEWVPNRYGGRENLDAIDFLRRLNELVYGRFPGCFTIAEESTAWGGVTSPTYLGGLGFGFKWNMGWMHDTLLYFSKDPVHRRFHHNNLTFSMLYEYTENFINPLSHDEVVHGKRSLLTKMPGDEWQKFANLRLLIAYMYTRPGKKMIFMGTEIAPWNEWYHAESLDWRLANDPMRQGFQKFIEDLGHLYLQERPLWQDHRPEGFRWIDCNDSDTGVISYLRINGDHHLVILLNLTPVVRHNYLIGVPSAGTYFEILNSDSATYSGSNVGNMGQVITDSIPCHGYPQSLNLTLPPLAALVLSPRGKI